MIKCIAIDDEPKALDVITRHASQVDFLDLKQVFTDPEAGLAYLANHEVDLVFLDIQMPALTGMEIAGHLKESTMVIFTTAYSEYALEGYKVNAVDYLLKPFPFSAFLSAVSKAKRLSPSKEFVFLNTGHQRIKVIISEILCITAEGNYVRYHTSSHKHLVRAGISECLAEIGSADFVQIHRSTIVSLRWISKIENNHVYIGPEKFQISEKFRSELMRRIG